FEIEQAEIERWREQVSNQPCVREVLALDAFARCWIQEGALLAEISAALRPRSRHDAFERLRLVWLEQRYATFEESIALLAQRLARAAGDSEAVVEAGWTARIRHFASLIGLQGNADQPRELAMSRLAERLDSDIRSGTDRMIALHGLSGNAGNEVISRLAEHFTVNAQLNETKAAVVGGLVTGALAGLKADLASGGMSFGAGLLTGGVLGAVGAAGAARGYNLVRGTGQTRISWNEQVLQRLLSSALLAYLAVAHYGRGRGEWSESEHPSHWVQTVETLLNEQHAQWSGIFAQRHRAETGGLEMRLRQMLSQTALELLRRLYPNAELDGNHPGWSTSVKIDSNNLE
ncbi:MAG: DUF3482 domain-containing protein, partial [Quisquiliibacterium sp.]